MGRLIGLIASGFHNATGPHDILFQTSELAQNQLEFAIIGCAGSRTNHSKKLRTLIQVPETVRMTGPSGDTPKESLFRGSLLGHRHTLKIHQRAIPHIDLGYQKNYQNKENDPSDTRYRDPFCDIIRKQGICHLSIVLWRIKG
jgi:hypothetical protein